MIDLDTGWGEYETTVKNVSVLKCPNCGEVILNDKETERVQKIASDRAERQIWVNK